MPPFRVCAPMSLLFPSMSFLEPFLCTFREGSFRRMPMKADTVPRRASLSPNRALASNTLEISREACVLFCLVQYYLAIGTAMILSEPLLLFPLHLTVSHFALH